MRKYLSLTILFISLSLTFAQTAILPSGSGTEVDPYLIANLDNLYWLTQNTDKWGDFYYRQTANIDASATKTWSWTDSYSNDAEGLKSIGDDVVSSFFGTYDGQGFSIDDLYIRRKTVSNIGLFGNTWDATIKDLTLTNVSITSYYEGTETNIQYDFIGALVGTANGTKITNCHSSGNVTGGGGVGGLVGYLNSTENNGGNIENCSSICTVSGIKWIGGFIGYNFESIIKDSHSSGSVIGSSNISGEDVHSAGGFIGQNTQYSEIYRSYSTGSVTGENNVGGFVGANVDSYIFDCYSQGNVSGTNSVGGFMGYYNSDYIKNCYSTGGVSGNKNVGGLVGFNNNSQIENCFWDTETSEVSASAGGTGKTTLEMQTETTFTDAGWNFDTVWTMNGYPDLMVNPLPIELSSFSVSLIENGIELNWETATEINNYGFDIERKPEIGSWENISFVEGYGNSNSPKQYKYKDIENLSGKYFYRLKQIDIIGSFEYSNIVEINFGLPMEFTLSQNYPNPFNPTTSIEYSIPLLEPLHATVQFVQLKVYDLLGREVATLIDESKPAAGSYTVEFNASDLPSGIYIYKLEASNFVQAKKMTLIK